ncbi:MAG: hypothetical protein ACE5FF_02910 [Saprospiraceae bacterium]
MDSLEKYIRKNREDFDTGVPGLNVWANINRHLEQRPNLRIVWMRRLRVAAAVVVLLVAGGAIGAHLSNASGEVESLADISPEYAEMEQYFSSQVDDKMAKLASYRQDDFVKGDIQDLDSVYEDLKKELKDAQPGTQEQIIQAMIENYQTKIDILERVLEKVQTTNTTNLKTEGNEISL